MQRTLSKEFTKNYHIGSCFANKVANSELLGIFHEYYGNSAISYTGDFGNKIWGKVMSYLKTKCKLIKEIDIGAGMVTIYETDIMNEFLVRYESDRGKNFVFCRKVFPNGSHIYPCYRNYKIALSEQMFNGTYEEYLKHNITFGSTSPVGRKIE